MFPTAIATFTGPGSAFGDISCVVENASIIHGRDDPTSQPEADTTTFEIWGPIPDGIDIGSALRIDAIVPPAPAALDAPAPRADDPLHPTLSLGPVTMTFIGRSEDMMLMFFRITCTGRNLSGDYPVLLVLFSNYEDGGPGGTAYYADIPGCDGAGQDYVVTFTDFYQSIDFVPTRGFKLKWNGPPGTETEWKPLPLPGPPGPDEPTVYRRFTGLVTDIELSWEDVPAQPVCRVTAAGPLAGMGHTLIGETTMPAAMDGERANFVITDAGAPTDPARSDSPGTIHVIPRPPDRQAALQIAQEAAEDGGGVLWQTRDGLVLYADALHRDGKALDLALDPCTIPLDITWVKNLEGLCNDVTVTYYEDVAGTLTSFEQHVWDEESMTRHGIYATSLGTRIAGEGDAITRGARLIFAQAEPVWRVAGVGLHLELLDKMGLTPAEDVAMTGAVLNLEIHDLVSVAGMPYGSPINPSYLFIEGWTETISFGSWHVTFAVSDFCQTAAAETWDEVDSVTTWHTYEGDSGDVTWDTLPCHPPSGA